MSTTRQTISCRCGAIHIQLDGAPIAQFHCHCRDCQQVHAGAYVSAAAYPADAVTVTAGDPQILVYKTTPRLRCADCGTFLFSDAAAFGVRTVNAYLLPEGMFQPQFHVQCQDAVHPIADDLPHFKDFPAMIGGSDERVDW